MRSDGLHHPLYSNDSARMMKERMSHELFGSRDAEDGMTSRDALMGHENNIHSWNGIESILQVEFGKSFFHSCISWREKRSSESEASVSISSRAMIG